MKCRSAIVGAAACVCAAVGLVACGSSSKHAHRDGLIVLDRSIGGVALRARRSDVDRRLGRGHVLHVTDQKPPEPQLHIEEVEYPNGLEVEYVSGSASARARGRAVSLLTYSPTFRTEGGVGVGSSAAQLRSIGGVTCGNLLHLDCSYGGAHHNQPGTFFRLDAPNGKVTRVAIGYSD